jgi:hypothetical protein
VIRIAPGTSAPALKPIPRSRSSSLLAKAAVPMPMGMFTKKIQCQSIV